MFYKKIALILILLLSGITCFCQSRYISETTKKVVHTRDKGKCKCCGSSLSLEYDHIIPYSCGGSSSTQNIQLLCQKCNRSKSNSCTCKIHNKVVGKNCCEGNSNSNNSSTSKQCVSLTKNNTRCRNKTTNTNSRCYLHQ